MQDASDAAGKVSSQQAFSRAHADVADDSFNNEKAAKIPCAVTAGGPETPQADPAMQDASDAAGKASSQQGPSQDHPDVPKRTPASDGTGESAAEDQPMIEPGSHADMLVGFGS